MLLVEETRVRGIVYAFAIFLAIVSASHGSSEIETSYENGIQMLREVGKGTNVNAIRNSKRSPVNSTNVGLWFGPRLGKRRKSNDKPEIDQGDVEAIAEALNAGPWALVSIPRTRRTGLDRRQATQFTPRLGRELTEEAPFYDVPNKLYNQNQEIQLPEDSMQQQQQHYASRDEREQLSPLLQSLLQKALI